MSKWEYITVQLQPLQTGVGILKFNQHDATNYNEQLNSYGLQGWKLVSVFTTNKMGRIINS